VAWTNPANGYAPSALFKLSIIVMVCADRVVDVVAAYSMKAAHAVVPNFRSMLSILGTRRRRNKKTTVGYVG